MTVRAPSDEIQFPGGLDANSNAQFRTWADGASAPQNLGGRTGYVDTRGFTRALVVYGIANTAGATTASITVQCRDNAATSGNDSRHPKTTFRNSCSAASFVF